MMPLPLLSCDKTSLMPIHMSYISMEYLWQISKTQLPRLLDPRKAYHAHMCENQHEMAHDSGSACVWYSSREHTMTLTNFHYLDVEAKAATTVHSFSDISGSCENQIHLIMLLVPRSGDLKKQCCVRQHVWPRPPRQSAGKPLVQSFAQVLPICVWCISYM